MEAEDHHMLKSEEERMVINGHSIQNKIGSHAVHQNEDNTDESPSYEDFSDRIDT